MSTTLSTTGRGGEIEVPESMDRRERILHGSGAGADPQRAVLNALQRDLHGRGSPHLPDDKKVPQVRVEDDARRRPLTAEEVVAEGERDEQRREVAEVQAGEEPAAEVEVPEIDWRQRALDLEQRHEEAEGRHRSDMLAMQDHFNRQLEVVANGLGQRAPATTEVPVDPDVSPGQFFKPIVGRLEGQVAQLASRLDQRDQQDRLTRVSDRVGAMVNENEVFRGKGRVGAMIAAQVTNELFDPANRVTFGNMEVEAKRRIAKLASEFKAELTPPRSQGKARDVQRTMEDARRAPPTGRGAETPANTGPVREPAPKNFLDPEARRRWAMPLLDALARESAD